MSTPEPQKIVVADLLGGGLGNQMFQWAFGLAVARKLGLPFEWNRKENSFRAFDLAIFGLDLQPHFYPPTVYENMGAGDASDLDKACAAVLASKEQYCGIRGHFQSEHCFANVADEVRATFRLDPIRISPEGTTQVAVQVRRGDYVGSPIYDVCGWGYFIKGMSEMKSRFKDAHFVFVSDDMPWCQDSFGLRPDCTIMDAQSAKEGLQIMVGSAASVISNSTYGWQGAWLSGGPTVVPSRWLRAPWKGHSFEGVPCESWIKVDA
jgi:hypothetical protein